MDRAVMDRTLSSLGKRRFLLHNVHESGPSLFHTRWAMSYLAGPLTIAQVRDLVEPGGSGRGDPASRPASAADPGGLRPLVDPGIPEVFVTPSRFVGPEEDVRYVPHLLAEARMHFVRASWDVDHWDAVALLARADDPSWESAQPVQAERLERAPDAEAAWPFAPLPAGAADPSAYRGWRREVADVIHRTRPLRLYRCAALDASSTPGETEAAFRARIRHAARERRDREVDGLRDRFEQRLLAVRRRERSAEERIAKEEAQYDQQRLGTVLDVGSTLLGSLFGSRRRSPVTGMSRAARRLGRAAQERTDIRLAQERLDAVRDEIAALEADLDEEIRGLEAAWHPDALELETLELAPRKADIEVDAVVLAWIPFRIGPDGAATPLADV